MHPKRIRTMIEGEQRDGPVIYWMSRDQRAHDNWALLHAQAAAAARNAPLAVVFSLLPSFANATLRHYAFVLKGLREVAATLADHNIPFFLLRGEPQHTLPQFIKQHNVGLMVSDFSPIRAKREWNAQLIDQLSIPYLEVDTHNVLPVWETSPKQEFAARTIRSKINKRLTDFLDEFPTLEKHKIDWPGQIDQIDWDAALNTLDIDRTVPEIDWAEPGEQAGQKAMGEFITQRLERYDAQRNNPNVPGQSNLSPYIHYGHIAVQRLALDVRASSAPQEVQDTFLEEVIVRRELSDNFCFYNENYDNLDGIPDWAKKTLEEHANDPRPHLYTLDQFEHAQTHDAAWNAAHTQMVREGKMHGYMRMYWCKKMLEWTASPAQAMEWAIYLNDKYEIDGRDPNGYVGIAWSIGGVHDRPWFERPVFGKIRYMSYGGLKSKFDVEAYIKRYSDTR